MKFVAWFMVFLLLASVAGVGYLYATAQVVVEAMGVKSFEAQDQQAYFNDLKQRLENETVLGTVYQNTQLGEASSYVFLTYTIRLRNDCLVTADMIEVQIVPTEYDILQLGNTDVKALLPHTKGDLTGTVLAKRDTHAVRQIIITYYIWGIPFTLKETYG